MSVASSVSSWPSRSTPSCIVEPGTVAASVSRQASASCTGAPSTVLMMSPTCNPASAAGLSALTAASRTTPDSSTRPQMEYTPTMSTMAMIMCITEPAVMTHMRRA
ncbi:MAG: hypothetical protein IPL07_14075 [Acidimicrobiaceae bacterium]|nr:hypothetical protein [Acidimicrobiaceae bacterium]